MAIPNSALDGSGVMVGANARMGGVEPAPDTTTCPGAKSVAFVRTKRNALGFCAPELVRLPKGKKKATSSGGVKSRMGLSAGVLPFRNAPAPTTPPVRWCPSPPLW